MHRLLTRNIPVFSKITSPQISRHVKLQRFCHDQPASEESFYVRDENGKVDYNFDKLEDGLAANKEKLVNTIDFLTDCLQNFNVSNNQDLHKLALAGIVLTDDAQRRHDFSGSNIMDHDTAVKIIKTTFNAAPKNLAEGDVFDENEDNAFVDTLMEEVQKTFGQSVLHSIDRDVTRMTELFSFKTFHLFLNFSEHPSTVTILDEDKNELVPKKQLDNSGSILLTELNSAIEMANYLKEHRVRGAVVHNNLFNLRATLTEYVTKHYSLNYFFDGTYEDTKVVLNNQLPPPNPANQTMHGETEEKTRILLEKTRDVAIHWVYQKPSYN